MFPWAVLYLFSVAGMIAGASGWFVSELFSLLSPMALAKPWDSLPLFGAVGLFVGATICAAENVWMSGLANAWRDAVIGAATGVGGGVAGGWLGILAYQNLVASNDILARVVAFVLIGLVIGVGQALHPMSVSRAVWGLIGGMVGGVIAGLLFWVARFLPVSIDWVRVSSVTLMGGLLALAIHAIVSLSAHVELVGDDSNIAKYDGRFHSPVFRDALNVFGNGDPGRSSPKANLQIRANDPDIDAVHAILEWSEDTNRYLLTPLWVKMPEAQNQGAATYVNNQQVTAPIALKHGDTVQLGKTRFHFRLRRGASKE